MLAFLARILGGGLLDRVLSTVDKQIDAQTDREALKADIIREYHRTKADWMRSGGFFLLLMFAAPVAFWSGAVFVYSVLWCAKCAFPQAWSIAAVPPPFDSWAGVIIAASIGALGVVTFRR